jgi:cytochrome c oxidase subunit 3
MAALVIFAGFNLTFFPQYLLGYAGMPRRYHSYPEEFQVLHVLSSAGAVRAGAGLPAAARLPGLVAALRRAGGANPWQATGLEWQTRSPPPTCTTSTRRLRRPGGPTTTGRRHEHGRVSDPPHTPQPAPPRMSGEATADFGMWVFIASEILFFGPLLLTYAYGRARWPEGFAMASRHTDVLLGTLNTALLLTSSFCAAAAVAAHGARRPAWTARLLAATALLGVAFLCVKGLEYRKEWHEGLFPGPAFTLAGEGAARQGAQLFFAFYFTATGLHALHVGIGAVLMAGLAPARAARPTGCRGRRLARVAVAGLYWHFVDIVWVLLYPLIYLVGRHP